MTSSAHQLESFLRTDFDREVCAMIMAAGFASVELSQL